eukprot:2315673-Rhodomonas_salina.1
MRGGAAGGSPHQVLRPPLCRPKPAPRNQMHSAAFAVQRVPGKRLISRCAVWGHVGYVLALVGYGARVPPVPDRGMGLGSREYSKRYQEARTEAGAAVPGWRRWQIAS